LDEDRWLWQDDHPALQEPAEPGRLDDSLDDVPDLPSDSVISGFWRRPLAFMLDGLLVGLVGFALGAVFFDSLARLGGWGRLVGFLIALAYFGVLNSRIGGGQTVGKRVFKIHVVDREGRTIPLGRSSLRYAILAAPIFLNQLAFPTTIALTWVGAVVGWVIFGLGGAIIYLYVFNRKTRQSVHDLAVGTFVTRTAPLGPVERHIWRPHLIVVAAWSLAMLVAAVAAPAISKSVLPDGVLASVKALEATGNFHTVSVMVGTSWQSGTPRETTYVRTFAVLKQPPTDDVAVVEDTARRLIRAYPDANNVDLIAVDLSYGFDLGIARGFRTFGSAQSPDEWTR